MTSGCNIFRDKTPFPEANGYEDTPVRTAQVSTEGKGIATLPGFQKSSDMAVEKCTRPRRGHDY